MVLDKAPQIARKHADQYNASSCIVHKLIEKERLQSNRKGHHVEEDRTTNGNIDGTATPEEDMQVVRSRLLTKKQLANMAMGVRTLAKKLGSLKVKLKIRTVFLLTKIHDETLILKTREVAKWLLSTERDAPYIVWVENILQNNKLFDAKGLLAEDPSYEGRLKYWDNEVTKKRPHTFDFVITLGGDGTVLYASWLFQRVVPPVLSFALGSLGFLTKFDFDQYAETLTRAFRDGVTISLRLRFEGTIMRSRSYPKTTEQRDLVDELVGEEREDNRTHRPESTFEILNDIVVDRGPNPSKTYIPSFIPQIHQSNHHHPFATTAMSTIELFGDEEHLTTVQADGICVATPTGSTAYNLAAGGSLCHPENPVILLTAICAHTLSFRPIILPDTMVLRIGVPYNARGSSWASFDGRERIELQPGDYVTVSASRYPFANVMPPGRRSEDWINSISRTLQWNSRQKQQKAFRDWEGTGGNSQERESGADMDKPQDKAGLEEFT